MEGFNRWLREVVPPLALVLVLDLGVTVAFMAVSGSAARIGTLRPLGSIPEKGLELFLTGVAVGLVTWVTARRPDFSLLTLAVGFVALIAADHLPSAFGIPQPIRPAHTFVFLIVEVAALGVAFRRRPELVLLAIAAWFGHVAGDQGVFAFFAPFSFDYTPLGPYRIPFAMIAAAFALATGYVVRRGARRASIA